MRSAAVAAGFWCQPLAVCVGCSFRLEFSMFITGVFRFLSKWLGFDRVLMQFDGGWLVGVTEVLA
jgi:hypothetical protein